MRTLQIHAKKFGYRAEEKALEGAEELTRATAEVMNALVAFVSVERGDGEEEVENASKEICEHAKRVGASTILLYPYAHLSSSLESPEKSKQVLKLLEEKVRGCTENVFRAPFGWYKEFYLESFGHPMAELSRSFRKEDRRLIIKLSKKIYEKLIKDYFIRFGLTISGDVFIAEEPWRSLIFQGSSIPKIFCTGEEPETLLKKCREGGLIRLSIRPGGDSFYDALIHTSVPSEKIYEELRLLKEGEVYLAEGGEGESIAIGLEHKEEFFLLKGSFVTSLIVDKLLKMEKGSTLPPTLPISFSPYQIAVLKIGDVSKTYLQEVMEQVKKTGLERIFLDDSPGKIGEKLRTWGMRWTPLVIIVGKKKKKIAEMLFCEKERQGYRFL